jgi:hypothetical protein
MRRQRRQNRGADDAIDHQKLGRVAEDEQQEPDRGQRQQGGNAVAVPGEKGEIAAQHDQRAVQHVDDVEHAPHQRKADRKAGVERTQHDPVHQRLQISHHAPSQPSGWPLGASL